MKSYTRLLLLFSAVILPSLLRASTGIHQSPKSLTEFLISIDNGTAFIPAQIVFEEINSITRTFSIDKFLVVGSGRSPTLLTTALNILHPGSVLDLPMTSAGRVRGGLAAYEDWAFTQFERFIPPLSTIGQRALLLIDFVDKGDSIKQVEQSLRKFLELYRPGIELQTLVFVNAAREQHIALKSLDGVRNFHTVFLSEVHFLYAFDLLKYFSRYSGGVVGSTEVPVENSLNDVLRDLIARSISLPLRGCAAIHSKSDPRD